MSNVCACTTPSALCVQLRSDLSRRFGVGAWERLQHLLKQAIVRTVNSTIIELTTRVGDTSGCFQLFGADFIVDSSLRPWLTEIQLGPGLSHDEPVKAAMIPSVVDQAALIGLQAQQARSSTNANVMLANLGRDSDVFETLINEARVPSFVYH